MNQSLSNLVDWAQDRTTRMRFDFAINPLIVGILVLGILAAVAWLFRKDL